MPPSSISSLFSFPTSFPLSMHIPSLRCSYPEPDRLLRSHPLQASLLLYTSYAKIRLSTPKKFLFLLAQPEIMICAPLVIKFCNTVERHHCQGSTCHATTREMNVSYTDLMRKICEAPSYAGFLLPSSQWMALLHSDGLFGWHYWALLVQIKYSKMLLKENNFLLDFRLVIGKRIGLPMKSDTSRSLKLFFVWRCKRNIAKIATTILAYKCLCYCEIG